MCSLISKAKIRVKSAVARTDVHRFAHFAAWLFSTWVYEKERQVWEVVERNLPRILECFMSGFPKCCALE